VGFTAPKRPKILAFVNEPKAQGRLSNARQAFFLIPQGVTTLRYARTTIHKILSK